MKKHITEQTIIFFSVTKWILLASFVGVVIGALVALFLNILYIGEANRVLLGYPYYYLLPLALVVSVWLTKTFAPSAKGHGTEKVIEAVHKNSGRIPLSVIPVKLLATVITIVSGGSVGKEGPSGQIGAGAASAIASLLKFSDKDRKVLAVCGISAGFAAVFGTPIAGAIFGVEVLIIGIIMYDVLLPSFVAGFASYITAQYFGIEFTYYDLRFFHFTEFNLELLLQVTAGAIFFGIVSTIFIIGVKRIEAFMKAIPLNEYVKAFISGVFLIGLVYIFGERYLGLGLETIKDTLNPFPYFAEDLSWYSFLVKTLFTSVTLGGGGSGGVITPIFFVGSTSGYFFGTLVGDHINIFAAIGFVAVLAGTTNTPIASTIMAVELFGVEIAHYAALAAIISFLITGHRSIFSSQRLGMAKSDMLKIDFGDNIDESKVAMDESEIKNIRDKIHFRRRKFKETKRKK